MIAKRTSLSSPSQVFSSISRKHLSRFFLTYIFIPMLLGLVLLTPNSVSADTFDVCTQAGSIVGPNGLTGQQTCQQCFDQGSMWTAVGCVPYVDYTETVRAILTIGIGISGTTVIMMILYGSLLMSTSQGDLKRVEEARTTITSAVMGALFILFSVTILRFIGVKILNIPGFG